MTAIAESLARNGTLGWWFVAAVLALPWAVIHIVPRVSGRRATLVKWMAVTTFLFPVACAIALGIFGKTKLVEAEGVFGALAFVWSGFAFAAFLAITSPEPNGCHNPVEPA